MEVSPEEITTFANNKVNVDSSKGFDQDILTDESLNESFNTNDDDKISEIDFLDGRNAGDSPLTEVQNFYSGLNVFITGATGFLGKILLEKLLRSCPGVENIYVLVRKKKDIDVYTRVEEMFEDQLFDRLKMAAPKFRHKVVPIPGDCNSLGLGLTLEDQRTLEEKVNIIFHSAATVKFDEQLRTAMTTNVRAPLHLLKLAKNMKALKVFMHISTAYSNAHHLRIEETFYPCDVDFAQLEKVTEKMADEQIEEMLPELLGPWPNTYTFTKALAEKEMKENSENVPLAIFRPAIVTSTANEPLKGWIDNMYGPTGVAIGCGTGILRTLHCDEAVTAEIVPADLVVNCLLVAAARVAEDYTRPDRISEPPIFNYVSSVENRITWKDFMAHNMRRLPDMPFSNTVWHVSLTLNKSAVMNQFFVFLLHILPAVFMDAVTICVGKKPKMLKIYRKIHKFSSVLSYFCTKEIQFDNTRTRNLWKSTSPMDKKIFPFSMSELSWDEYFNNYLIGIRRHLFKQSDDTLPQAKIKLTRLYYMHQAVKLLLILFFAYLLWSVFNFIT